ncbi:MAG: hypothetical protein NUV53_00655, partial [Patescibacteria group bacterium]|nr:hypothetical protein [Patescibacteria group bacterium]
MKNRFAWIFDTSHLKFGFKALSFFVFLLLTAYSLFPTPVAASTLGSGSATSSLGNILYTQGYDILGAGSITGTLGAPYISSGVFGLSSTKGSYTFQHYNSTANVMYIDATNDRVGIGTTSPAFKLDVQGSMRIGGTLTTHPIGELSASTTQAKRYEVARLGSDQANWGTTPSVFIDLYERYYSTGGHKRYEVRFGYGDAGSVRLLEATGGGILDDVRVQVGPRVLISGNNYYLPVYVDADYYSQWNVIVTSNSTETTSDTPAPNTAKFYENPTGSNIASFAETDTVYHEADKDFFAGNVGIGTTGPEANLHVEDTEGTGAFMVQRSGQELRILAGSKLTGSWPPTDESLTMTIQASGSSSGNIAFATGNSERMRILSSGNVGIGTTEPGAPLMVSGSNRAYIDWQETDTTSRWRLVVRNDNGFFAVEDVTTGTSPLTVTKTTGNVGIGTTAPGAKLEVSGGGELARFTSSGGAGRYIRFQDSGSTKYNFITGVQQNVDNGFEITPSTAAGGSTFSTPALVVAGATGNVGIGTGGPADKLEVNYGSEGRVRFGDGTNKIIVGLWDTLNNRIEASGKPLFITSYDGDITLGIDGATTNFVIDDANGNVGIGTTAPTAALHITSASDTTQRLNLLGPGSTDTTVLSITRGSGSHKGSAISIGSANYTNGADPTHQSFLQMNAGAYSGANTNYITAYDNSGIDFQVRGDGNVLIAGSPVSYPISLPATGGSAQWVKLGTLTLAQIGRSAMVKIVSNAGHNAAISQNFEAYIRLKTSNSSSVNGSGFAGDSSFYSMGQNGALGPGQVKWVANAAGISATAYDLYVQLPNYTGAGSYYTVETASGSWAHSGATGQVDPGSDSTTVLAATKDFRVTGTITADAFSGPLTGTLSASYTSAGVFGSNSTKGNYEFQHYNSTADVMYIDATNDRVGIGTTGPEGKLDIVMGTGAGIAWTAGLNLVNGSYKSHFIQDSTTLRIRNNASGGIQFNTTGGGYIVTFSDAGNVGIGTASPVPKLHLQYGSGNYGADSTSGFINEATSGRGTQRIRSTTDNPIDFMFDVNGAARWDLSARGSAEGYPLHLYGQGTTPSYGSVSGPYVTVLQGGNVGIGATAPLSRLEVYRNSVNFLRFDGGGGATNGNFLLMQASDYSDASPLVAFTTTHSNTARTNNLVRIHSNETSNGSLPLRVTVQGTVASPTYEALAVNYQGKVGIGTTGPSTFLQIVGSDSTTTGLEDAQFLNIRNNDATANNYTAIGFKDSDGNDAAMLGVQQISHVTNEADLVFAPRVASGNITERMRIKGNGNVGIGTTGPGAKLEINAGGTNVLKLGVISDSTTYNAISLNGNISDSGKLGFAGGGGSDTNLYYDVPATGKHQFRVASANKVVIDTNGNVGIGTTGPDGKLHIAPSADFDYKVKFIGVPGGYR